jgi:hypothetical protein
MERAIDALSAIVLNLDFNRRGQQAAGAIERRPFGDGGRLDYAGLKQWRCLLSRQVIEKPKQSDNNRQTTVPRSPTGGGPPSKKRHHAGETPAFGNYFELAAGASQSNRESELGEVREARIAFGPLIGTEKTVRTLLFP